MKAGFVLLHLAGASTSAVALFVVLRDRVGLSPVIGLLLPIVCLVLGTGTFLGVHRSMRGRARDLPALRMLFVFAVGGWIAILAWAQPSEPSWILIAAGMVAAVWHIGLALRPVLARVPARARRTADLSSFSLAAAIVLLELALRLAGTWSSSALLARTGDMPEAVLERLRRPPGQRVLGFPCNRLGYYDDEPRRREPGEHLVASIGDSFSFGSVPHALHYTTVCERALGVPVQNFGIDATGPAEYLRILVDDAIPLDPDLVAISIFVGNDLSPLPDDKLRLPDSLRGWFDRDSVLLSLVPRRLERMGRSEPAAESGPRREPTDVVLPWTEDPALEQPSFSEASYLAGELHRARVTSHLDRGSLGSFFAAMRAMRRAAGSAELCVLLIPDESQVEDDVWRAVLAAAGGEDLHRDRAQELLVPWFAENEIACLDLLPVLRAVPAMPDGRKHLYHLRNTHWNARGSRVAGEAMAEFLATVLPRD